MRKFSTILLFSLAVPLSYTRGFALMLGSILPRLLIMPHRGQDVLTMISISRWPCYGQTSTKGTSPTKHKEALDQIFCRLNPLSTGGRKPSRKWNSTGQRVWILFSLHFR